MTGTTDPSHYRYWGVRGTPTNIARWQEVVDVGARMKFVIQEAKQLLWDWLLVEDVDGDCSLFVDWNESPMG